MSEAVAKLLWDWIHVGQVTHRVSWEKAPCIETLAYFKIANRIIREVTDHIAEEIDKKRASENVKA